MLALVLPEQSPQPLYSWQTYPMPEIPEDIRILLQQVLDTRADSLPEIIQKQEAIKRLTALM